MSSYKPKSLDELNNMYDKALSAQRAIKRGTSKINETNTSDSFFDDVIKEAELTVSKEPEKRIADLSVAVDDFIKHFSEPKKEQSAPAVSSAPQPKAKATEVPKTVEAPKIKTEKKAAIVATPSPAIARKQSGEHISNLMSDYVRIMNDQDDSDDEPKHRKSFLSRKKEKKLSSKEILKEEEKLDEESFEEPSYTPLSEEMKEDVFPFDGGSASFDEAVEDEKPSAASEEAFNAFSAMSRKKENFHKEVIKEEAIAEEKEEEPVSENDETADAIEDVKADESDEAEESVSEETEEETDSDFEDLSSVSEEADEEEDADADEDEDEADSDEELDFDELPGYSKGKNALRIITRVFLSFICVITLLCSLFSASLSTVFNVNTGKEVFGKYYFFTSSHDFVVSGVKAGDLVVCEKKTTVSDDETAVYIDLENRTFSFGVKDGSITDDDGDILYLIGENEVPRDDVLGTVHKTVPLLGDVITIVYKYYVPVITVFVALTIILLLVVIFALKKRKTEDYLDEYEDEEEAAEETEEYEEESEDTETDIFAELD